MNIYLLIIICFIGYGVHNIVDFKQTESLQNQQEKIYLEDEEKLADALEQNNLVIDEFDSDDWSWHVTILPNSNYRGRPTDEAISHMIRISLIMNSSGSSFYILGITDANEPLKPNPCNLTFSFDNNEGYEFLNEDCRISFYQVRQEDSFNFYLTEEFLKSKKLKLTIDSPETGKINLDYDLEKLWFPCLKNKLCNSNVDTELSAHHTYIPNYKVRHNHY